MNTGEKKMHRIWKAKCFHHRLSLTAAAAAAAAAGGDGGDGDGGDGGDGDGGDGGGEEGSGRMSVLISGAGGRKHPVETAEKRSKTGQRQDSSRTEQCVLRFRLCYFILIQHISKGAYCAI